jgi:hypothetical protein
MKIIIIILQAILNLVRKRRDLIANRSKIPPEYRDDVVVWYSPKKQRLTNYDVIESYAEDFTYWTINNTSITSAQKKIVIPAGTELEYIIAYRGFNASTDGFDIKYTGNIAITYRYNKEDGTVGTIAIDKSGIYHLPASVRAQKNFGFYCNPQTVTEEATIEQFPTSILKDFSGNGLDAYMYGFTGKLNSGVGIYKEDFTGYSNKDAVINPFTAILTYNTKSLLFYYNVMTKDIESYNINVKGIINEHVIFFYKDEEGIEQQFHISKDGNYTVPKCYRVGTSGTATGYTAFNTNEDTAITITQIPDYPNSLCYASKQYCKAYGLPIFDDYTIIARRTWFDKDGIFANKGIGNYITNTAFAFEYKANNKTVTSTASFGGWNNVNIPNEGISYQTKNKYNNADITYSIGIDKSEEFAIGAYNSDNHGNFEGCHDDIIVFKRSLAINEINDITEAIFNETIIEE